MAKTTLERPASGALVPAGAVRVESDDPEARNDPGNLADEPDAPDNMVLEEVLAQLGEEQGQARCMIWRIPTDVRGDEEFLYELTALDFARRGGVNDLAKRYGAGIYRIRVYRGGKIYTHKRIKIGAPIIQEGVPGADLTALRGEVTTSMAALAQSFKDGIAEVAKIFSAQAKPLTLREQLGDLIALKDFMGGASKPASALTQLKDMAELMTTVKSLMPTGGGDSGMGGALMRLGEKFLPEIVEAVKKAAPAGVRAISEAPDGDPASEDNMGALRDLQLKMALDFLVDSAARGLPAGTYADVAIDKVPALELSRLLNRADWMAELNKIEPRVLDHQAWFIELREEILKSLREAGTLTAAPAAPTLEGKLPAA